ncbi:MAG: methylenetetrahydrofolate reductase [Syntrophobacteraceae bacterium]|nr:methylenetetrahydrofolate reductase [Syntrophobacteraceae bacterium]
MSFQKRLLSGEFVVLAEMNTPKGVDTSQLIQNARRIKGRVDAVIVPDMDDGVMKMSALGGAVLMHQQGMEALIHVYCRDRNRMALQGDLLAAYALGVQSLIVVSGEDICNGDHRDARAVDDLDELGLLRALGLLEQGTDLGGSDLQGAPSFTVGCVIPQCKDEQSLDCALELAGKKVEAGAKFVLTPPVFDIGRFESFMDKAKSLKIPVISTVYLLKSVGAARYIATNEPEAGISEELIRRIRKASDREMECVRIAAETVASLKLLSQGVRIVTLGWEHRLPDVLDYAGL